MIYILVNNGKYFDLWNKENVYGMVVWEFDKCDYVYFCVRFKM